MSKGEEPTARLKQELDAVMAPIERLARDIARQHERAYLGIDTSPAPGKDRSIGAAIEALTRAPFGSAGTLEACAAITAALKTVSATTCGYSRPDAAGARRSSARAARRRGALHGTRSVAVLERLRTGLDVAPIPATRPCIRSPGCCATSRRMSVRLRKALSVRLFLVPGKKVGEFARFTDHWMLTDSVVMKLD